jgi:hypothetical protein
MKAKTTWKMWLSSLVPVKELKSGICSSNQTATMILCAHLMEWDVFGSDYFFIGSFISLPSNSLEFDFFYSYIKCVKLRGILYNSL